MLITIAHVILAKLPGGVAQTFEYCGDCHIRLLPAFFGTGQTNLCHTGANWHVAAQKCGAASGTTLLAIIIREGDAFAGKAIDVGSFITHHATIVVADVPRSDVVSPENENVWFLGRWLHSQCHPRVSTHTENRHCGSDSTNSFHRESILFHTRLNCFFRC